MILNITLEIPEVYLDLFSPDLILPLGFSHKGPLQPSQSHAKTHYRVPSRSSSTLVGRKPHPRSGRGGTDSDPVSLGSPFPVTHDLQAHAHATQARNHANTIGA